MLTQYRGEFMVALSMITNNLFDRYQNGIKMQYHPRVMTVGGYHQMRESLYTQVIIWLNTILKPH